MVKRTGKAITFGKTEAVTEENGLIIKSPAMEFTFGLMAVNTKEIG
jgi:hypothetical protein